MAKNFRVFASLGNSNVKAEVCVSTMMQMNSVVNDCLSKGRDITVFRTDAPVTALNSAAAIAYIDVELFQLIPGEAA